MAISIDKYSAKTARNGYLWRVRFTYRDAYGKEHPHTKRGFKTKKEAEAYGVKKLKELQNTSLKSTHEITLSEIWDQFLTLDHSKLGEESMTEYRSVFKNHIQPVLGDIPIQQLGFIQLQTFFDGLTHFSNSTLTKIKSTLSHCFRTALKMGVITSSPLRDIELNGKRTEKKDDYITPSEYQAMEDQVKCAKRISEFQIECRLMILRLGYYMGLRFGEILGLRFSDIDWDEHTVEIKRQVVVRKGGAILSDQLKTKASYATLPICSTLYNYLVEWRKMNPFDYVVPSDNGDIAVRRTLENYFRNNFKEGFHVHQLRHTFATNLYLAGVDQVTAASLTRHQSVEILNNIYTHPQTSKKRDALERVFG